MQSISAKVGLWQRLRQWAGGNQVVVYCLIGAMIVVAGGLASLSVLWWPQPPVAQQTVPPPNTQQDIQPVTQTFYSPLTGVPVGDEPATKRQVTAIMLENSPDSRPQSGLKPAGVVFEAIAEGGITRFLTLHQEDRPSLIGPVRSLRPYYVDWLAPFDAAVAHVGGSANALKEIRNGQYKDIDQFFNGGFYWRATDRAAPHNVYTSFEKLDELNQKKGFTSSTFKSFARKQDSRVAAPNATSINVTVSGPTYNSHYTYDAATNAYLRNQAGAAHTDREAGQITPKVVIVIKVPAHLEMEDGLREQMTTTGSNEAFIFQDGSVVQGFWRKADRKSQIEFYDKSGRVVGLNPGQTWLTAIAPAKSVTWQ